MKTSKGCPLCGGPGIEWRAYDPRRACLCTGNNFGILFDPNWPREFDERSLEAMRRELWRRGVQFEWWPR